MIYRIHGLLTGTIIQDHKGEICPRGADCESEQCDYSHSKAEQKMVLNRLSSYRTEFCKDPANCEDENCLNAHRKFELRKPEDPMSKGKLEAAKKAFNRNEESKIEF